VINPNKNPGKQPMAGCSESELRIRLRFGSLSPITMPFLGEPSRYPSGFACALNKLAGATAIIREVRIRYRRFMMVIGVCNVMAFELAA
jgi:hypothetical protein